MITLEKIKALKPCEGRLANYVAHYGDRSFTPAQFMRLRKITHEDMAWVAFRLMPTEVIRFAVADVAESVLHIYESAYPDDDRPRRVIEAARAVPFNDATAATVTADAAAATKAAYMAARVSAAWAANAAYGAIFYAAGLSNGRANDSVGDSLCAAPDRSKQGKLVRKILLKYWK